MRARFFTWLLPLLLGACHSAESALPIETLHAPPGFSITLLARIPAAREMTLGDGRVLYVGSLDGNVRAIQLDPQYHAGAVHVVASGLNLPIGVAWRNGSLYVSEVSRILRLDDIGSRLPNPPQPVVVRDDFPTDRHHGPKFIAFGPDGWLYVPVGAPCNVCLVDPDRYGVILRMKPDGSDLQVFARGVRNTVGFDWDPATGHLWFTDNGRDMLGDDLPPDKLNEAPRAGLHFGFPYCHGGFLPDPLFAAGHSCAEFIPPAQKLGAHVASLGMRFYTGSQFPESFRGAIFIAEHGSWNRTKKSGYRVSVVRLEGGHVRSYEPFVTGWLQGETAWGRPVDVLVLPDGSLLVSDDHAGAIYRIRYEGVN
jgi:glucose/arabinose dehydrogenase